MNLQHQSRFDYNCQTMQFFPEATEALIFDVDGTLYDQVKLRRRMFLELLCSAVKTHRFSRDIKVLHAFRKNREMLSKDNHDIYFFENRQYSVVAHDLGMSIEDVQNIIGDWIFKKPLNYLGAYIYPGVKQLFPLITYKKKRIGIFSDYPVQDKLRALGLYADAMVCSTDRDVDRFKPHPKGLLFTAEMLGVPVKNCFFIGDRDDKDGECARRAGMPYFILPRHRLSVAAWYQEAILQMNQVDGELFNRC